MNNFIILYLCGLLISTNIVFIWFFTGLKLHLFKAFKILPKETGLDEFDTAIYLKNNIIGELLSCPICFSTHIAFIVSSAIYLFNDISPILIVIGALSYPCLIYALYSLVVMLNSYSSK